LKRALRAARPALVVRESHGVRELYLGGAAIQSAMRLSDPLALELDYTRCMMAFLLFLPAPRDALMIGLGGGSLAKFLHYRLPGLRTRVIERDERVIAAAREHFHLPPDDGRLAVEHGEGVEALTPGCCDVLLVDGFENETVPAALVSPEFLGAARGALRDPGVLVMNFMDDDPALDRNLRRIERAFGGATLCLPALRDPNIIAFALRGAPGALAWAELRARAAALARRYGLPFARYIERLRKMNRWTREKLFLGVES
jgi:spermidine synthase